VDELRPRGNHHRVAAIERQKRPSRSEVAPRMSAYMPRLTFAWSIGSPVESSTTTPRSVPNARRRGRELGVRRAACRGGRKRGNGRTAIGATSVGLWRGAEEEPA
jgi:hypothetical protein